MLSKKTIEKSGFKCYAEHEYIYKGWCLERSIGKNFWCLDNTKNGGKINVHLLLVNAEDLEDAIRIFGIK